MRAIAAAALVLVLGVGAAWGQETDPVEMTEGARKAVNRALEYLRRNQQPNGAWRGDVGYKLNNRYEAMVRDQDHVGVTALACMAFMAAGNLPGRGKYGDVVTRGLGYVLACVDEQGFITANGTRMYSHAFATLFLAEIFGMTADRAVHEKLKRAIRFIVVNQNDQGGWRYAPGALDTDMSIVVCQVQALRAARNIGIAVPRHTIEKAQKYVRESYDEYQPGVFKYQNDQPSRESFALSAAGVTSLQGMAIYDDRMVETGLDWIWANRNNEDFGHYFFYYGHYYAVQAMYIGGLKWPHQWRRWYPEIQRRLVEAQNTTDGAEGGSWANPIGPGPCFGTAMGALILQIPYRYLPIFQR